MSVALAERISGQYGVGIAVPSPNGQSEKEDDTFKIKCFLKPPKVVRITKELAQQFANMEPCIGDRPLSKARMSKLSKLLGKDNLKHCVWCKAFCKATDKDYRINGKHTSHLFSECVIPKDCYVTVCEYVCDSLKDVATIYAAFDNPLSSRTMTDILIPYKATEAKFENVIPRLANIIAAGISYKLWGRRKVVVFREDRVATILDEPDFVVWANDLLATPEAVFLRKQGVVAAMFATWKVSQTDCKQFWGDVCFHSSDDSQAARYFNFLRELEMGYVASNNFNVREIYVRGVKHWNLWREGSLNKFHYSKKSLTPEPI
jgi:hypothetical protein